MNIKTEAPLKINQRAVLTRFNWQVFFHQKRSKKIIFNIADKSIRLAARVRHWRMLKPVFLSLLGLTESFRDKKFGGTLACQKMTIWGTLSSKTQTKGQSIQSLAAPLAPSHGTRVFCGTPVGNHYCKTSKKEKKKLSTKNLFLKNVNIFFRFKHFNIPFHPIWFKKITLERLLIQ